MRLKLDLELKNPRFQPLPRPNSLGRRTTTEPHRLAGNIEKYMTNLLPSGGRSVPSLVYLLTCLNLSQWLGSCLIEVFRDLPGCGEFQSSSTADNFMTLTSSVEAQQHLRPLLTLRLT
jgi:hypothetical protein